MRKPLIVEWDEGQGLEISGGRVKSIDRGNGITFKERKRDIFTSKQPDARCVLKASRRSPDTV